MSDYLIPKGRGGADQSQPDIQALKNAVERAREANTQNDRSYGTPKLAIWGGAGDKDYRTLGYGSKALKHHVLVVNGASGQQMNSIALNTGGIIQKVGTPVLTHRNGTSGWGNRRIEDVGQGGTDDHHQPATC